MVSRRQLRQTPVGRRSRVSRWRCAEGRVEGRAEGVKDTVGKMVEAGVPVEVVAKALEMSVEEIQEMLS